MWHLFCVNSYVLSGAFSGGWPSLSSRFPSRSGTVGAPSLRTLQEPALSLSKGREAILLVPWGLSCHAACIAPTVLITCTLSLARAITHYLSWLPRGAATGSSPYLNRHALATGSWLSAMSSCRNISTSC